MAITCRINDRVATDDDCMTIEGALLTVAAMRKMEFSADYETVSSSDIFKFLDKNNDGCINTEDVWAGIELHSQRFGMVADVLAKYGICASKPNNRTDKKKMIAHDFRLSEEMARHAKEAIREQALQSYIDWWPKLNCRQQMEGLAKARKLLASSQSSQARFPYSVLANQYLIDGKIDSKKRLQRQREELEELWQLSKKQKMDCKPLADTIVYVIELYRTSIEKLSESEYGRYLLQRLFTPIELSKAKKVLTELSSHDNNSAVRNNAETALKVLIEIEGKLNPPLPSAPKVTDI